MCTPSQRYRSIAAATALVAFGFGCASPTHRFERHARSLGFAAGSIEGAGFEHAIFSRPSLGRSRSAAPRRLHLYVEDDGLPWIAANRVAVDPTPRNTVLLELLAMDPADSVLLGRPCYHGAASTAGCNALLWTHQRYSERVVASLSAAARELLRRHEAEELALFGYSGGGTLAMLMAAKIAETKVVVTIAANLDTTGWTELHGFSPLDGSLDPATEPPLPVSVRQLHLAGGRDGVVPPRLVRSALVNQKGAEFRLLESFDHSCCWKEVWPEVLDWSAR